VTKPEQRRRGAKQRLLEAADELFYGEGIRAVGIDRVIAHAGVAKGSLYYSFTGKDELVHDYLTHRHDMVAGWVTAGIEAHTDPRDRILAVYDVLALLFAHPDYRGCAFVNAVAEASPDGVEARAATTYRTWVHDLFLELASEIDAENPRQLAQTLVLLYDGAVAMAQMDKAPDAARTARRAAERILEDAAPRSTAPSPEEAPRSA
jgi:AcrR family transcriptional regulator